jgi:hypothetical protein
VTRHQLYTDLAYGPIFNPDNSHGDVLIEYNDIGKLYPTNVTANNSYTTLVFANNEFLSKITVGSRIDFDYFDIPELVIDTVGINYVTSMNLQSRSITLSNAITWGSESFLANGQYSSTGTPRPVRISTSKVNSGTIRTNVDLINERNARTPIQSFLHSEEQNIYNSFKGLYYVARTMVEDEQIYAVGVFSKTAPNTSMGKSGDFKGLMAADNNHIYYCAEDYTTGNTHIWKRQSWSSNTW